MTQLEEIAFKVSKDRTVIIRSTNVNTPLDSEVFAVNWFNTKNKWLYNCYNVLAVRSVYKVGARPIFKGEITKKILGDDDRKMLLIVKYPSVKSFKSLLEKLYFKVISVIRIKAVRDFNFGFTTKDDFDVIKTKDKSKVYAVHHYRGKIDKDLITKVFDLASKYQVIPFYAGSISSLLFVGDKKNDPKRIPCILDGILLWFAEKEENIQSFIADETYKELLSQTSSSYIGILKRSV